MRKYTIQEIEQYLADCQLIAEADIEGDNMTSIINRANLISSKLAQSGKILADIKYHRNEQYGPAVMGMLEKMAKEVMYADAQKKYLMSVTKHNDYLVDWADRLNATLTHQLDYMRSLLSKEKEMLRLGGIPESDPNNAQGVPPAPYRHKVF